MIPYGRQYIDEADIQAVIDVLRSDWLTTGPVVDDFEKAVARKVGAGHAVAVNSGTAALHAAMHALGIVQGDEVIIPAITFVASANCVVYQGGTPVFADVDPDKLLLDVESVRKKITFKTRAIIAVDYAGQPCDYDELRKICNKHSLKLIADACHSLGGAYKGSAVGSLADLTVFSFHPVKHITTGEGGMIVTDNQDYAERMRRFRNHGIATDHRKRAEKGTWFYEMEELGYNYRITDFQCALGLSQLSKLDGWIVRRQQIAARYGKSVAAISALSPLTLAPDVRHAFHLYVVRVQAQSPLNRDDLFAALRSNDIGVNVHYSPVYLHPFYQKRYGYSPGLCPMAEREAARILSLPMYASFSEEQQERVVTVLSELLPSTHP